MLPVNHSLGPDLFPYTQDGNLLLKTNAMVQCKLIEKRTIFRKIRHEKTTNDRTVKEKWSEVLAGSEERNTHQQGQTSYLQLHPLLAC